MPLSPPRAETFDELRERIRDRFEAISPHLQRIARFAMAEPNQFALQTIAVIAEKLSVQPSTLIRFAKEFGYDGFSGMQQVFKLRLIEGAAGYREQVYETQSVPGRKHDATETLNGCIDELIASLERLRQDIRPDDLSKAIELCLQARHIYVAGLRRARPVATYFAYGMTRLERRCSLLDFAGWMAAQQVANMDAEDILVSIAFTPYSQPVIDATRDANFRNLPVIAITDIPSSPLAVDSSLSFYVDNGTTGQFRPLSGAIGLVQSIIVGLSEKL